MVKDDNTLNQIKSDIEVLMNQYNKDNTYYSESEITYIRFGLTKALQIINKYNKLLKEK